MLSDYVRGRLVTNERASVEQHAGVCRRCAKELDVLTNDDPLLGALREAWQSRVELNDAISRLTATIRRLTTQLLADQ
jgi:anti-sigma factor RsiW